MKKVLLSVACGLLVYGVSADEPVVEEEGVPCGCAFDGVHGGLGISGSFLKSKASLGTPNTGDKNANTVGGTLILGGGKAFKEKYYLGLDAYLSLSKSKKADGEVAALKCSLKQSGVVPRVFARFGIVVKQTWLPFFKIGAVFSRVTLEGIGNEVKCSKVAMALGAGVEKVFCKNFSGRVEAGYTLKGDKEIGYNGLKGKLENKGGFDLCALVTYNVKF